MQTKPLTAELIFIGAEVKLTADNRRQDKWARVLSYQDNKCLVEFNDGFKDYFQFNDFVILM